MRGTLCYFWEGVHVLALHQVSKGTWWGGACSSPSIRSPKAPDDKIILIGRSGSALLLLPWHHKLEVASLLRGYVKSPDSPLGLLINTTLTGKEECLFWCEWMSRLSTWSLSLTLPVMGCEKHYCPVGINIPALLGLLWHYPGREFRVPCYIWARVGV